MSAWEDAIQGIKDRACPKCHGLGVLSHSQAGQNGPMGALVAQRWQTKCEPCEGSGFKRVGYK